MIRPATPLSLLFFAAFILLLLSVISIPVTNFVALGQFKDVKYGVFGYCQGDQCSSIGLGYSSDGVLNDATQTFNLPTSVRRSLSSVLAIHPVAAFLSLAITFLAIGAHMHSPAHSARFLTFLFIFTLLTFVVSLVASIVDILLFVPHLAWGSYVVLVATIILAIGTVVSCAMRRTIVGRKARQKRIDENAEMSGENFYNREGQIKPNPIITSQPTVPVMGGDALPAFATFENKRKDDQVSDERIPLTQRSPTDQPGDMIHARMNAGPAAPMRSLSRERFGGGPVNDAPGASYGSQPHGRGRGGPVGRGGFRGVGREGFGAPPGRGGPRGAPGYGPPRGGYGPGGLRGGRGPPPVAAHGNNAYPRQYAAQPSAEPAGEYPAYHPQQTQQMPPGQAWSGNNDLPRAESPPPLPGRAVSELHVSRVIDMDAVPNGSPNVFGQHGQIRNSDTDVVGMVGLQQNRAMPRLGRETVMSEASRYSSDDHYVPPRAAWNQAPGRNTPRAASPAHSLRPAAELAEQITRTGSRGNYYEDVDPRFDGTSPLPAQGRAQQAASSEPYYEDVHAILDGARSPAESERSNFTSISQRGVNPQWEPHPPMPNQASAPRRPPQTKHRRQDMLLNNNPDFQLPGSRVPGANRGGGPRMTPGSAYPTAI